MSQTIFQTLNFFKLFHLSVFLYGRFNVPEIICFDGIVADHHNRFKGTPTKIGNFE